MAPKRKYATAHRRNPTAPSKRCRLLELPAELREQIWLHAVTEWTPAALKVIEDQENDNKPTRVLAKSPIRMDRFNRFSPPAITRTNHQFRSETLHLYYSENIFECWRPLFWAHDWSFSTFIDWLDTLGPQKISWLREVVLLYKNETELEHELDRPLGEIGFVFGEGVVRARQELSEYEMCYEELGLPKHFGKKKGWNR